MCELSEPKKKEKIRTTPSFALAMLIVDFVGVVRERRLNPNFFFSNFLGAPGISRQNPGISRPKSLISLVSRDVSNFLAPPPVHVEDPEPHWKISGPKSLGLGSFFLPEWCVDFAVRFWVVVVLSPRARFQGPDRIETLTLDVRSNNPQRSART